MRYLRPVLERFQFVEVELPSWKPDKLDDLIEAMANWRTIAVDSDASAELRSRCAADGTPGYARLALSRVEKGSTLTLEGVKGLPATVNALWQDTWTKRIASHRERICLFYSLSLLHEAGIRPLMPVVLELASRLMGRPRGSGRGESEGCTFGGQSLA